MSMCCPLPTLFLLLFFFSAASSLLLKPSIVEDGFSIRKRIMKEKVRKMFYHAYENYMIHAFPHDELKPISKMYTDSLSELGNLKLEHLPMNYNGSALTRIESLSSLLILGNTSEFERAVLWLSENLSFDVDVRVNLFECNIRVLGGLVSAHILATDTKRRFYSGIYKNQLLNLAEDLGRRFLVAFNTPSGLPYAWINLKIQTKRRSNLDPERLSKLVFIKYNKALYERFQKRRLQNKNEDYDPIVLDDLNYSSEWTTGRIGACNEFVYEEGGLTWAELGVMENETTETSTSGCGSLILEMGTLSRLTGDSSYEVAALRALRKIWSMRSPLNLVGTTLDVVSGEWIEYSSGIGAGVDSFYEYLLKAYILFGNEEFWNMFQSAYVAVQKYFRHGPWYHEADIRTGKATYWQLTSLQAFWPGLQILVGDITAANSSHREFFHVWEKFGVLPERYLLDQRMVHPTEKYYPLRPELAESTFYLYQATKDPWYLDVGESIIESLNRYTKVDGGFASIRDVMTMQLEDHQHSFFLSETCKYLYLLFDDSFLANQNYVFTTEGHLLPVRSSWQERLPEAYNCSSWAFVKSENQDHRESAMSKQICPAMNLKQDSTPVAESACHVPDAGIDHRCKVSYECGVDSVTCRQRTCSMAGYCGLWLLLD